MKIDFDSITHTYWIDGVRVPYSVTGILKAEGFIDFSKIMPHILEAAANFGKAVHSATQLYDSDDLDYDTFDSLLEPYLDGWIKFKKDVGWINVAIEQPIGSKKLMIAGTSDRKGMCTKNVRPILLNKLTTLDIKSVHTFHQATALQTAGYMLIENEGKNFKDKVKKRLAVNLTENGKYNIERYDKKSDEGVFLSALNCLRWKGGNL